LLVLASFTLLVLGGFLERLIGVMLTPELCALVKPGVEDVSDQSINLLVLLLSRPISSHVVYDGVNDVVQQLWQPCWDCVYATHRARRLQPLSLLFFHDAGKYM